MGAKPVIKCCECQKTFSAKFNLRKHGKKYHPDKIDVVAPKKTYSYHCEFCKRNYSHLKDLNYHKNKVHKDLLSPDDHRKVVNRKTCPLCAAPVSTNEHFAKYHDIAIESIQLQFASFEDFKAWKGAAEKDSKTLFVKQRGTYSTDNVKIVMYICHRSGFFITKGKGVRRLRNGGSKKINGYCPASMRVVCKDGVCQVDFVHTHVGHESDPNQRKKLIVDEDFTDCEEATKIDGEVLQEEVVLETCCDLEKEKEEFKMQVSKMIDDITTLEELQVLKQLLEKS